MTRRLRERFAPIEIVLEFRALGFLAGDDLRRDDGVLLVKRAQLGAGGGIIAHALREDVARIGATRVEGFEAAEPENLASGGYVFAAETKTTLGIDIPEGGLEPMTARVPVQASASSLGEAAVAFAKACRTEADKAKATYGERFVAASCAKPSRTGTRFEGELVAWFVP